MDNQQSLDEMLRGYFLSVTKALGMLHSEGLTAHALVILYSTIDTLGLLGAPPGQSQASGDSFKRWVKKYLLHAESEYNDVDLWAARCAVLHTFTTQSKLSNIGSARELQYFSGDKSSESAIHFFSFTLSKGHVPVHVESLLRDFVDAMKEFVKDLEANCLADEACMARLRNVIQNYPV